MRNEEDFGPERFRLTTEQLSELGAAKAKSKPKRRRQQGNFVQVPNLWIEQLCAIRAHGSTYRVAMHLLHEVWRTGNRVVKLTNVALAKVGVGREGKAIALRELRKAGLIAVEQHTRQNPVVTVRFSK
jgi:hypothetical protein